MRKVRINYIEGTHSFRMRVFPRYRCLVFRVADFTINYSICFTVEVDTEVVPVCIFISKLEAECLYELISNCVTPLHRQATAAGCSWVLLSSRLRNSAGRLQRLLIQPDCWELVARGFNCPQQDKGLSSALLFARNKRCRKTILLWEGILRITCAVFYCEKRQWISFLLQSFSRSVKYHIWGH